jgi:hypothetical protein
MNASFQLRKLALPALLSLSLLPLHASDKGPKPDKELQKYAGEYTGETRTKTESLSQSEMQEYSLKHHGIDVSLGGDGSATVSQSPNGDDEVTIFGTFKVSGGQLTITFEPSPDGKGTHALWPKLPPPPLHKTAEVRPSKAGKR